MKWVVLLLLLRFVIQINVSFERSSPEVHVSTVDLMQINVVCIKLPLATATE
jgi:hypothetical protein